MNLDTRASLNGPAPLWSALALRGRTEPSAVAPDAGDYFGKTDLDKAICQSRCIRFPAATWSLFGGL